MFTVAADSRVTTISELRKDTKKTLAASQEAPVYVLKDGKPVAALVSLEMLEMVNEARENHRLAQIATRRLAAIEAGEDEVMDEPAFWRAVEQRRLAARKR